VRLEAPWAPLRGSAGASGQPSWPRSPGRCRLRGSSFPGRPAGRRALSARHAGWCGLPGRCSRALRAHTCSGRPRGLAALLCDRPAPAKLPVCSSGPRTRARGTPPTASWPRFDAPRPQAPTPDQDPLRLALGRPATGETSASAVSAVGSARAAVPRRFPRQRLARRPRGSEHRGRTIATCSGSVRSRWLQATARPAQHIGRAGRWQRRSPRLDRASQGHAADPVAVGPNRAASLSLLRRRI